jgi:hypothetical protein
MRHIRLENRMAMSRIASLERLSARALLVQRLTPLKRRPWRNLTH